MHTFDPNVQEAEVELQIQDQPGPHSWVPDQPKQYSETLSQKTNPTILLV
jgi:hypothetical protein